MTKVERLDQRCARTLDEAGEEKATLFLGGAEAARAAEREAERAERLKLIEAMSRVAGARDAEKAEWQATVEGLTGELATARAALSDARRETLEAIDAAAKAREARENDRVLYQTDRTSWAHDKRQLEIKLAALRKEAARGWLSRLVRGAGAV